MKALLCVFLFVLSASAQDQQGSVYTVSTYKIPFDKIAEYFQLYEQEAKPDAAQNEFILSQKQFTHAWGPDWTVLVITEYKDLASIQAAQKRTTELFQKRIPDKARREEISKKFYSFLQGHTDALVVENLKLRK